MNLPLAGVSPAPLRASAGFMVRHPAHLLALGFGSGLAPRAPGTVGTLWAWAAFLLLDRWLDAAQWGALLVLGSVLGCWACTVTAQHMGVADPASIVWDEVVAFWAVLWLVMPAGLLAQLIAFVLFRYFDTVKPGPVRWADRLFKPAAGGRIGWRQGVGILLDDLVAAGCTLLVMAAGHALWNSARWT